jgi:hypothetical protein
MNLLDRSTNRAKNDGEVEGFGLAPLMKDFIIQSSDLLVSQVRNGSKLSGVTRNKCTLLQLRQDIGDIVLASKLLHVVEHFGLAQVCKWILDPGLVLEVFYDECVLP